MDMEDMLWSYQENIDELKQKLLYTTLELDSVRAEANEEMSKNREYVNQLIQLLKIVSEEREEARNRLQKLLNKTIPSASPPDFFTARAQIQLESPPINPTKPNSSTSESNSLSDAFNYSSPVDSFFDAVSSPDLSKVDRSYMAIDNVLNGKSLPEKGKLLEAVMEAGPLLQTLLVAGPLPRWRNPPPLQPFQIAPANLSFVPKSPSSSSFVEMSCGSSQILPAASPVSFADGPSGSWSGKRQRFQ